MQLKVHSLTAAAFAPFGDVIEVTGHAPRWINDGTCERFDDLAHIDVAADGGRAQVSLFRAQPRSLPFAIEHLERHPLSSQAFYPLQPVPFLIVVAEPGAVPEGARLHAFMSSGEQGINFRRNTWHHALLALHQTSVFLVVDRGGPGENCEERHVRGEPVSIDEL
jgi:ureidoglycolate lyase